MERTQMRLTYFRRNFLTYPTWPSCVWNETELNSNIGCTSHLASNPLNSSLLDSTQINSFVSSQQQLATKKYYFSGMWDKSTEGFVVSYGTMLFIRERILGTWVPGSKRDSLELDILNSLHLVFVSYVYWQIFKSAKEMTHSIQFRVHGMCRHAQRKGNISFLSQKLSLRSTL